MSFFSPFFFLLLDSFVSFESVDVLELSVLVASAAGVVPAAASVFAVPSVLVVVAGETSVLVAAAGVVPVVDSAVGAVVAPFGLVSAGVVESAGAVPESPDAGAFSAVPEAVPPGVAVVTMLVPGLSPTFVPAAPLRISVSDVSSASGVIVGAPSRDAV